MLKHLRGGFPGAHHTNIEQRSLSLFKGLRRPSFSVFEGANAR